MTATQDDTIAELQRANAELRREREAALAREATLAEALATRTAELTTRNSEYVEQIEHQLATVDVLSAMSESPGDPQPVFVLITRHASECCKSRAVLWEFDGKSMHFRASHGAGYDLEAQEAIIRQFPAPPNRGVISARAVLEQRLIHIADATEDPEIWPLLIANGARSYAAIPLMRDGKAIGAISMNSPVAGGFSESQIELLKTFAEQAVIAITSAETYRALQRRTVELQESLDYQTATSDLLKVISRSTFDLQPVLDTLIVTTLSLCNASQGEMWRKDGEVFRHSASHGNLPAYREIEERTEIRAGRGTLIGRVALERAPVLIIDAWNDPEYEQKEAARLGQSRSMLGVPLLRDGELIGAFALARTDPVPFTDRQVQLVRAFADQAVIAIENTRLITEQKEALEQQTATAEVLQVINGSLGELTPVFDAILEKATRLCDARRGQLATFDGEYFRFVAVHGDAGFSEAQFTQGAVRPEIGVTWARIVAGEQVVHMVDVVDTDLYRAGHEGARRFVDVGGGRTLLTVALRKDDLLLGALTVYRQEVRAFTDKHIELLRSFAAQAVIAMENARLLTEQREALEQQTATAEVLQVINASPGNLVPVFDAMLDKALGLCDAAFGILWTYDGTRGHAAALRGVPPDFAEYLTRAPHPVDPGGAHGRLLSGEPIVHIADAAEEQAYRSGNPLRRALVELGRARTLLAVPLRKDNVYLGHFVIYRREVRPFFDKQIALLRNFAAQAVIAMENARLITEQREALEQQTATAEVLQVINASPGNLTPVFDAILEKAHRLCGVTSGSLQIYDGEKFRAVAVHGLSDGLAGRLRQGYSPGPNLPQRRLIEGDRVAQVADMAAIDDPFARSIVGLGGVRTLLCVALRKDDALHGQIVAARPEVRPFSEKEIALLKSFADQAVIAMENARLITEQREALEQQTATAEVLQVINASPGDLAPVFDAMLEKALRLCDAVFGTLLTFDGDQFHTVAQRGLPARYVEYLVATPQPGPDGGQQRVLRGERFVQFTDMKNDEAYRSGANPAHRAMVDLGGARTGLIVPLRKDDALVGTFTIYRQEVRAFSEKQIALLENFAAQAVIAMENARLLTETREALERQTATAEVLGVINSNPGDLAPVFDAMLEKAMRLCDGAQGTLWMFDGERMCASATAGYSSELAEQLSEWREIHPFQRRLSQGERVFQIVDLAAEELYHLGNPLTRAAVDVAGIRTVVFVALVKDAATLGGFTISRREVHAFSDKHISLLQNFAEQAVIAIENARLLTEQQEALEQQTATAEVLQVINASPGNLAPVFDAILEKAHSLCDIALGSLELYDGERFRAVAVRGSSDAFADMLRLGYPASDNPATRPLIEGSRFSHIRDLAETDYSITQSAVELNAARTLLCVPLRRDEALLGMIASARGEVRPFSEKEIALLENFAAQAVIAIENARLLNEQREALEQQTATAEVLQVINASPGNLAPVFDAMLEKAMRLCDASFGLLYTYDGERFHTAAQRGVPEALARFRAKNPPAELLDGRSPIARLINEKRPVHTLDILEDEAFPNAGAEARSIFELGGARTILNIPLVKDDALQGAFTIYRQEVRPFSDKQIALLENFAAQAVIAMENARLITETREALEQQTATAEVLQVINANPGNLAPVFDTMLEKAMRLCDTAYGIFATYDGDAFLNVAWRGVPPALVQREEFLGAPIRPRLGALLYPLMHGEDVVHVADIKDDEFYRSGNRQRRALVDVGGARTVLEVALRKDNTLLGAINVFRQEVHPFTDKQIALLQNFAAQAVIAMENARLLDEIRRRQEELRVTFDNMGDGVAMFDETQHLVAWNRKFQDILDVPDDIIARPQTFSEYVHYLAERGEYDPEADPEEHVRRLIERAGQSRTYERTRPDGRVIEIRHNPVPGGGFVLIYADITERKRSEEEIRAARDAAETALRELRTAQANLIQAEKMASLGQLTAGIAHEIKNPLNFVNNFSALSTELIDELRDVLAPEPLGETARTEVDDLTALLKGNLEKVVQHGQRADGIVRSMLDHSRGSSGERRIVDLNMLIDEALNLAYHGARAQDQSFNITLERDFGAGIAPIEVNPQDITRVFLNLFSNGFYAATRRAREGGDARFEPTLMVTTIDAGEAVEIRVRDNGTGIPADIRDKLFQPFFTTKPTGEGTGLGLSITYDIVTQQHGGSIAVDSKVGDHSEFTVRLPRKL